MNSSAVASRLALVIPILTQVIDCNIRDLTDRKKEEEERRLAFGERAGGTRRGENANGIKG
jgi:hypothetical protein